MVWGWAQKTTKRLDRLSQPVVRSQNLVKAEAEGRAEALRRARTAARMASVGSPLAGSKSGAGAAARQEPPRRASTAAPTPSARDTAKSSRALSVTKATARRIGMLMRTANAMKLTGMAVPDGVEDEMAAALEDAEDGEGAVEEVLRSYSVTDAEFLSQTASHIERERVETLEAQLAERGRAQKAPSDASTTANAAAAAAPAGEAVQDQAGAAAGGGATEGEEESDEDSPEQRVLRATMGYQATPPLPPSVSINLPVLLSPYPRPLFSL